MFKVKKITKIERDHCRLSHVMSVAPNASSSLILGNTSPSIEPMRACCYRQDTLSGSHLNKNKYLDQLIKDKCNENIDLDYDEVWSSIMAKRGSISHLDIFSDWEKQIFKTAIEIDQRQIVQLAADRQVYIDQAQSVNLFFRPDTDIKYLHAAHFSAWKKGLKTLYYCRSEKIGEADKVSERIERQIIEEIDIRQLVEGTDCLACEG
jgi:ribonucleoside-diphosphate reductase alpha chain